MRARVQARQRASRRIQNNVEHVEQNTLDRPEAWRIFNIGGTGTSAVNVTHGSVLGYPPLWRAVNLIANGAGKLPFYCYGRMEDDSRERAREHPAYRLMLRKPNPIMTSGVFKKVLTLHAQIDGNGYGWIERTGFQDPINVWPLQPSATFPVLEQVGMRSKLWYVTVDSNGQQRKVPPEDILHIKGPSYDGYMGLSVIDIMREALGLGMAARQFAALYFKQGFNARGFLKVPQRLDEKQQQQLREQWPKMEAGLRRAHLPVVLHGGMEFESIAVDPDKAQALQTRQFEVREVANITGVPPHMLGDDARTSYNSLEMESQSFLDHAVDPWLIVWEEEANDKLLSDEEKDDDSHYFEFLRDALLRVDAKTQGEINHREREDGISSVNDILKRKNRPPIGPEGDVRHVPANWMILTDKPTPAPGAANPAETKEDAGTDDDNAENKRRDAIQGLAMHTASLFVNMEAEDVLRAAKRESNFIAWYESYYERHREKVAKAFAPILSVVDPFCDSVQVAFQLSDSHVRESISTLLDTCDGEPSAFVSRIEAVVDDWRQKRAAELTADIMGECYAEAG